MRLMFDGLSFALLQTSYRFRFLLPAIFNRRDHTRMLGNRHQYT